MPIYTPDNFYGRVFVDGVVVDKCFFADTDNGIVKAYKFPFVINKKNSEVESYDLTGSVSVQERDRETGEYL